MAFSDKKFVPPGARAVVDARNAGELVNSVFIADGWPSDWLKNVTAEPKRVSEKYPSVRECNHAIGVVKAAADYLWHWVIGLDVILWAENIQQATRLESEVFPLVLAENPLRVTLLQPNGALPIVALKRADIDHNGR